ncbi:MAG: hypothetical protein Q6373_013405 [Candidatus Sigynarchaeota archaeon]
MEINPEKIVFKPDKMGEAKYSGLAPKEIRRLCWQIYRSKGIEDKVGKKIDKRIVESKSKKVVHVIYTWLNEEMVKINYMRQE